MKELKMQIKDMRVIDANITLIDAVGNHHPIPIHWCSTFEASI